MSPASSAAGTRVIELEEVSIASLHRSGVTVLQRVDWRVEPGEFWVVAGHHASGKSDLLMTLAGLIAPGAGRYRLLGEAMPIFEDSRLPARLKAGLVFNGGQLLNQLTLGQNVTLPLRYHHDLDDATALERASQLMEALELTPFTDRMPGAMGRQWNQRAGLARALVMQPELLLLDDPLSGLDVRHTAWWIGFLDGLCRGTQPCHPQPLTLVVTADTLAPWGAVATHCAVLEQRTLVPMGCLREPQVRDHARVREYLAHNRWGFDRSP
ncbi:MAG: ATP-binding cassette domain-containing protein [Verrucomicrobia bacterium]|jgi:ABC-type transporter Mla maintaining outer membrane lipid asymmetry ATPase subunit MlaF|nr:ATP-binding cassette domain-containing protein [Verrucomicrobiota bacterium]